MRHWFQVVHALRAAGTHACSDSLLASWLCEVVADRFIIVIGLQYSER